MEGNFIFDCRWSTECDSKFINDFNYIQDLVFKGSHTYEGFKHQYLDNIYGPSILVVVYDIKKPIAARGLWRNDVLGREAYQPGRTCVLPEYRGKGVFVKMTTQAVAMLPTDALIYNFPNQYSFPGYIKMGWESLGAYYLRLFSVQSFIQEHPIKMDSDYFDWWIQENSSISCIKRNHHFFIVRKMNKPFCYKVIAIVDKEIASKCKRGPLFAVFFYYSQTKTFYNKSIIPLRCVGRSFVGTTIPLWKIDAV